MVSILIYWYLDYAHQRLINYQAVPDSFLTHYRKSWKQYGWMHDVLLCSVVPTTDYNKVDIHSVVLHSRLPPILRTPQLPILHSFFLRLSQFKHFLTTSNASQINWVLALVAAGHKVRLHQTHWECWALPAAQVTWMRAESTCWRRTPPSSPSSLLTQHFLC